MRCNQQGILTGFLLVGAYISAGAQHGDSALLRLIPRQAIKVSPLHLLNFYPTIEVSYEFQIARRMSLQLETGYVLTFPSEENDTHRNKRGVKLKLEGRYFFPGTLRQRLTKVTWGTKSLTQRGRRRHREHREKYAGVHDLRPEQNTLQLASVYSVSLSELSVLDLQSRTTRPRIPFRSQPAERGEKIYYGAIEPYMNVINFDRYEAIEECFDADCRNMYIRRYGYRMTYREQGVSLKVGMVWHLGSHFFLDYNAGLTLRIVDYDRPPLLPESLDRFGVFTIHIPDETDRTAIGPNMGLRFGYRFR